MTEKTGSSEVGTEEISPIENLSNSLSYLEEIITISIHNSFNPANEKPYPKFEFIESDDPFFSFVMSAGLSFEEFIILLLALAPHVKPNLLDKVINKNLKEESNFPEIGGRKSSDIRYMMPTGDTALFVLAGYDLEKRSYMQFLLEEGGVLSKHNIVFVEPVSDNDPSMSGRLLIDSEYVELFLKGTYSMPKFSSKFPAHHIKTDLTWDDLVISDLIADRLKEISDWINHSDTFLNKWKMKEKFRPGYLALLHGPPGTGKTFASSLLGKYTGREVFRVDLSSVVSKYIGETEKNLASLFDKAEDKDWILVFEEADSLFGKRTDVKSSNDRFANQEVSFLLQRIETFSGLVILTSNIKSNMDNAFVRRFNSIIHFPFPEVHERRLIWEKSFPDNVSVDNLILDKAAKYELAGGNIVNVVQYACIKAIDKEMNKIQWEDVEKGIELEIEKGGKIFKRIKSESEEVTT